MIRMRPGRRNPGPGESAGTRHPAALQSRPRASCFSAWPEGFPALRLLAIRAPIRALMTRPPQCSLLSGCRGHTCFTGRPWPSKRPYPINPLGRQRRVRPGRGAKVAFQGERRTRAPPTGRSTSGSACLTPPASPQPLGGPAEPHHRLLAGPPVADLRLRVLRQLLPAVNLVPGAPPLQHSRPHQARQAEGGGEQLGRPAHLRRPRPRRPPARGSSYARPSSFARPSSGGPPSGPRPVASSNAPMPFRERPARAPPREGRAAQPPPAPRHHRRQNGRRSPSAGTGAPAPSSSRGVSSRDAASRSAPSRRAILASRGGLGERPRARR